MYAVGGSLYIGYDPSASLVPRMPSLPPSTYPGVCTIVSNMSNDCLTHASVQGIWPATHWSYRSGPQVLSTICEIQSVSAQPPPPGSYRRDDREGCSAVCDHRVGQLDHLVPGRGNAVIGSCERLRVVPDRGLVRDLVEDPVQLTVVAAQVDPGRGVVRLELAHVHDGGECHELSRIGQLVHEPDVRQDRDVRRRAALDLCIQFARKVTAPLPVDGPARVLFPGGLDGHEAVELGAAPQAKNSDMIVLGVSRRDGRRRSAGRSRLRRGRSVAR